MKYMFSTEKSEFGYDRIILPQEIKLIEYIFEDMESFGEPVFKEFIDKVINNVSNNEEISGNICSLEINKDFTNVSVEFTPNGMPDECKIETSELLSLIQVWIIINKSKL